MEGWTNLKGAQTYLHTYLGTGASEKEDHFGGRETGCSYVLPREREAWCACAREREREIEKHKVGHWLES